MELETKGYPVILFCLGRKVILGAVTDLFHSLCLQATYFVSLTAGAKLALCAEDFSDDGKNYVCFAHISMHLRLCISRDRRQSNDLGLWKPFMWHLPKQSPE